MIRRLKKSFVKITMLSAALVLAILMGIVNLSNYIERTSGDTELLSYLAENGGRFPSDAKGGKGAGHGRHITEETPYETRYFSVMLTADGTAAFVDTSQIAAVSPTEAIAAAQRLKSAGSASGRDGSYRYTTVVYDGGFTMYVFLDCTRNMESVRTFLINSAVVTAAGIAALFGLAWLLAGRAVRPIAESYEKQKSFITNAGHELKTPLAVIESSTEVIEIENGESQWTRSIHGQVERLSRLTQDLIVLARMDEGTAAPTMADADISEIVSDVLEPFAMMAGRKGLRFTADICPGIVLRTDADAVEKICAVLADNAVKYAEGDIAFTLRREGGHVILRSENPAGGLTEGKQEQLFDRFYRADASRNSEKPGYGLGLPLARAMAETIGGRMQAHSPDGQRLVVTAQLS